VVEDYLPDALVGERIYDPTDSGFERELAERRAALDAQRAKSDKE
jgi:replication-associated recombination protein RarA